MTPADLLERNHQCDSLRDLWKHSIPGAVPSFTQFDLWLSRCSFDEVVFAVRRTARKREKAWYDQNRTMTLNDLMAYATGVMNRRNPQPDTIVI